MEESRRDERSPAKMRPIKRKILVVEEKRPKKKSSDRESNTGPFELQSNALPLSYHCNIHIEKIKKFKVNAKASLQQLDTDEGASKRNT